MSNATRRALTVHREWRQRKNIPDGVVFPHLRMGGKWLRDAGFEYGQQVTVKVSHGQLIIEHLHANPPLTPFRFRSRNNR